MRFCIKLEKEKVVVALAILISTGLFTTADLKEKNSFLYGEPGDKWNRFNLSRVRMAATLLIDPLLVSYVTSNIFRLAFFFF